MKRLAPLSLLMMLSFLGCSSPPIDRASPTLLVFDCGRLNYDSIAFLGIHDHESDVRELIVPCYVIEHEQGRLLWEGGLPSSLAEIDEARAGDAVMDLAVLGVLEPRLLPGILAGYAPTPEEDEVIQQLLPFYLFLRRLAAAEWNLMVGTPSIAQQAFALLNQFPFS